LNLLSNKSLIVLFSRKQWGGGRRYSTRTVIQKIREIALMGTVFILKIIPRMRSLRITKGIDVCFPFLLA
jgi:hypothetical protein